MTLAINTDTNNASEIGTKMTGDEDIKRAMAYTGKDFVAFPKTYKGSQTSPTVTVDYNNGSLNIPAGTPSDAAIRVQNSGSTNNQSTTTVYESRRFTKKQLEEARLANMRKNGRVCTKKTLFESEGEPEFDLGELVDFCQNNDFFIYIQVPMKGWAPIVVNTQEGLRDEISSDIYNTRPSSFSDEKTDEILQTLSGKIGGLRGIVKVMGTAEDGSKYPYYIVWEN